MDARRGQTELSFQWIFVLIAGVAFLSMFLFAVRSCSDAGTSDISARDLDSAAQRMSSAVWTGESRTNLTFPDADVVCVGGTMRLSAGDATRDLLRAPVYAPPHIGGRGVLITTQIELADDTPAPMPIGSVAYVLDSRTVYLLLQDRTGQGDRLVSAVPYREDIVSVTLADVTRPGILARRIPGSPRTVVIAIVGSDVDLANVDLSGFPAGVEIRGVMLQPASTRGGAATFLRVGAGQDRLAPTGTLPYATDEIGLGMLLAADKDVAACATSAYAARTRTIVTVAAKRAESISTGVTDALCAQGFAQAAQLLDTIAAQPTDALLLERLFASEQTLRSIQNQLLSRPGDCPGVM